MAVEMGEGEREGGLWSFVNWYPVPQQMAV